MLVALIAVVLLVAPSGEAEVIEPKSGADRVDRVAFFESTLKQSALLPCQRRFPLQADAFARSHGAWMKYNAERSRNGRKSIEDAVGRDAASESFRGEDAQAAMEEVLSGLPEAKRLPWCRQHFPDAKSSFESGVSRLQDADDENDVQGFLDIITAADRGHSNAEALAGMIYIDGAPRFDLPPEPARGLKYMMSAAEHGLHHAQLALGMHYVTGKILPEDAHLAEKWLTLGALQSDAQMHAALADMLEKGEGVPRSISKALGFYTRAADMGDAWAAQKAAELLLAGKGAASDASKAFYYALLALRGGSKEADSLRREASARLSAAERQEIEARLEHWQPVSPHPSAAMPLLPANSVRHD
jgi:TPR repeat protein